MHTPCACQDSGLRVIVLSYGWTTPLHPDPLGATLLRVADVLQHYVGTHAVFWDFCSLMQHSPSPGGPRRTPAEEATFGEGLVASGLLYAHRATIVFRLTTWPCSLLAIWHMAARRLGSAPARHLRLLRARLAALGGSWQLWAAQHSRRGKPGPTGAQPQPRGLELAASQIRRFRDLRPSRPAGYPEQYDLSGGANEAEYEDRGWCAPRR